jgi:glycosyltransferase involved in cell wall biosynthesis
MRLLFVTMDPPLPFGPAAGREPYVLLRELTARRHDVTMFSACRSEQERAQALALFPRGRYDLRCYPHQRPRSLSNSIATLRRPLSYPFSPELERDVLRALDGRWDALHVDRTFSGWLALRAADRALLNVLCLARVDSDPSPLSRVRESVSRHLMLKAELRLLRAFGAIRTLTPELSRAVTKLNPRASVHTVPYAFDPSLYAPTPSGHASAPVVALFGSLDWSPSRRAAERFLRLFPRVRARVPNARGLIVGFGARERLRHAAPLAGVEIVSDAPEMQPHFARTSVFLYPAERASGMKVKVLEALACGLPVVTTRAGAEGLPLADGVNAALGERDDELVERTVELLRAPGQRARYGAAGRAALEATCAPGAVIAQFEALYERISSRRRPIRTA